MFTIKDLDSDLFVGTYWKTGCQLKERHLAIEFSDYSEAKKVLDQLIWLSLPRLQLVIENDN